MAKGHDAMNVWSFSSKHFMLIFWLGNPSVHTECQHISESLSVLSGIHDLPFFLYLGDSVSAALQDLQRDASPTI